MLNNDASLKALQRYSP